MSFKNSKKFIRLIGTLLIAIMSSFTFSRTYVAEAETNKNNIIILLDNSGSMQSGIGDLAKIACNMAVDCLDADKVNIGIITFGEKVTVFNDIGKLQEGSKLKKALEEISFNEDYTNMKEGLREAINQLNKVKGNKSILILTDGVETAEGGLPSDHQAQLKALSEEAKDQGIKVNSIALAEEVEREFLNTIAIKTGGAFREGKTADKLFQAISSIVAQENSFVTVRNYSTANSKNEKIKISELIEEVVINVAAGDNIEPQVEVRLNGKLLEPSKQGNLYQVYRFSNSSSGEIEISQQKDMNTSVIIQLKSKAKLNVLGDSQNFLSLPINIPRHISMTLDCGENEIPEGTFIQRDGFNIQQSDEKGIFQDIYEGKKPGEEIIRYTAKDGNGGIIALAEMVISINDYPPYDYINNVDTKTLVSGDKISISIEPKGKTQVRELGGTLIVNRGKTHEEIGLVEEDGSLKAEFSLEGPGELTYYAYVRGIRIEDNSSFEYKLEEKTIEVLKKPSIKIALNQHSKYTGVLNSKREIVFKIMADSTIKGNIQISMLNDKSKEIGTFTVKEDTKEVRVKIPLKELTDNLTLRFKTTPPGVEITDSLKTNIEVISRSKYIWDKYLKIGLIAFLFLALIAGNMFGIYHILNKIYEDHIKGNESKMIDVSYGFKPDGTRGLASGSLGCSSRYLYLNFNSMKSQITLDNEEMHTTIGSFTYENQNEGCPRWIQGLKYLISKRRIPIEIGYSSNGDEKVYLNDIEVEEKIKVRPGERGANIRIVYSINKKSYIDIEFNL